MILAAMLAVPFLGALLTLFTPAGSPPRLIRLARLHGLFFSAVTLMLTLVAAMAFDYGRRGPQLGVDHAWAASIGLRFHLGVDGISLPLIVLTAALTFLCMIYTARVLPAGDEGAGSARALIGLILLLEVGMIGTFISLDLVLFFVFFEVVLIPMYFLIAIWGGKRRAPATRCSAPASCSSASCSSRSTPTRSTSRPWPPGTAPACHAASRSGRSRSSDWGSRSRRRCGRCTPGCPTRTPRRPPSARCCSPACC
jgi:NADH:ubiquinone oxidoreductase subunit 5 (subunit L)/multisubunit Na+/H+ antiporter MnhA subunit